MRFIRGVIIANWNYNKNYNEDAVILVSQMRKLSPEEIQWLVPGHTFKNVRIWNKNEVYAFLTALKYF